MASPIRGAAVRGIGRFLATIAASSASEREARRQAEEEAQRDLRRSQLEVGQTTLRQMLEDQSAAYKETLPSSVANTRQSVANTRQSEAAAGHSEALGVAAPINAESERTRAETGAAYEQRQRDAQDAETGKLSKSRTEAERVAQAERELNEVIRVARPGKDYEAVLNAKGALDLNTTNSPILKDWFDREYPRWLPPTPKNGDPGKSTSLEEVIQTIAAGGQPTSGTPEPIGTAGATPALPAAPGQPPSGPFSPGANVRITSERTASLMGDYSGALGAGPPAATASAPPAATAEPENTAGLAPEEVDYIRGQAQSAGLSFNEARRRLEAQLR